MPQHRRRLEATIDGFSPLFSCFFCMPAAPNPTQGTLHYTEPRTPFTSTTTLEPAPSIACRQKLCSANPPSYVLSYGYPGRAP